MGWWRVFYAAGGGRNRQIDLNIGPDATIGSLTFRVEPPERAAQRLLRTYLNRLAERNKFETKDHGHGIEIGAIYKVKRSDVDETPTDVVGGIPSRPDEPDANDRDPIRIAGAVNITVSAKAVPGRG